jgi:hypothetical protein
MSVPAAQTINMKIELRRLRKRAPEVFRELDGEVSDHLTSRLNLVHKKKPAR